MMKKLIYANFDYEQQLWNQGYKLIAGVDEVGRGCFAGPVVTAAVIFAPDTKLDFDLADSKLLSAKKRLELDSKIKEMAIGWAINVTEVPVINQIGIGKSTQQSFVDSIKALSQAPDFILIDAFYIQGIDKTIQKAIVKGDQKCCSIAAASIIAKVFRDQLMDKLDGQYPGYGFGQHKGYGTKAHQQAIKKFGLSDLHRSSFALDKFL